MLDIQNIAEQYEGKEVNVIDGEYTSFAIIEAVKYGYETCQKEYEEKLRWIPVEEKLPEIKTSEYQISVRYFDSEFNRFVYNVFDIEIDYNNESLKDDLLFNDFTEWRYFL